MTHISFHLKDKRTPSHYFIMRHIHPVKFLAVQCRRVYSGLLGSTRCLHDKLSTGHCNLSALEIWCAEPVPSARWLNLIETER